MANDPRIYFAAERTLLAWVRTGISIQGVGFLVAKFGMFLWGLGIQTTFRHQHLSFWLGLAFVLVGTGSIAWAAMQQWRFLRGLSSDQWPRQYAPQSGLIMAVVMTILGLLLTVYLALTSFHASPSPLNNFPDAPAHVHSISTGRTTDSSP